MTSNRQNAPPGLNDGQWRNQIRLYQPEEGIYLAPRAPGNTWDLWHTADIDPLFDRLIEMRVRVALLHPLLIFPAILALVYDCSIARRRFVIMRQRIRLDRQ